MTGTVLWDRIATAPRDGTMIMLAWGRDAVSCGAYSRNDDDLYPWKFLDSQGDGLPIFNGAIDGPYGPTHWAPMPDAPPRQSFRKAAS